MSNSHLTAEKVIIEALSSNHLTLDVVPRQHILHYLDLIQEWNAHINLTAHRKIQDLIYKDVIDNLLLTTSLTPNTPVDSILDMGSGSGFTGIILKIIRPSLKIFFLESNRKKMNFIRHACRELKLPDTTFLTIRAETNPPAHKERFDIVISRATWPLMTYLEHAHYYVQNNGQIIYFAGPQTEIRNDICISSNTPSKTHQFQLANSHFFNILPQNYHRTLLVYKKVSFT